MQVELYTGIRSQVLSGQWKALMTIVGHLKKQPPWSRVRLNLQVNTKYLGSKCSSEMDIQNENELCNIAVNERSMRNGNDL